MAQSIFHAYDVRGIYPEDIDETKVKRIAGAYAESLKPKTVAVGSDVRISSPSLKKAVIEGLTDMGVDVIDVGVGPTEMIYFAVGSLKLDGGIQVSASHNPAQYNGLKMVKEGVQPLSGDDGLPQIEAIYNGNENLDATTKGAVTEKDMVEDYVNFLADRFKLTGLPKLKIVANNNFGMSGPIAKQALTKIDAPVELIELNFQPDGTFPKGRPDPSLPANRAEVTELIKANQANLGVAWDADGDRCFIVDEHGEFLDGCYLTAILASQLLAKNPGQKIVYTPQNIWAVERTIKTAGGVPIICKHGHSFIKAKMRAEDGLFAGEKSGHCYYRDFFFADNGLITFLTFLEVIATTGQTVSQIVQPLRDKYFMADELSFKVDNIEQTINDVRGRFPEGEPNTLDGVSLDFGAWRLNIYASGTEPLVRLNIEATNQQLLDEQITAVTKIITPHVVNV
jgi:phosphomannomutase